VPESPTPAIGADPSRTLIALIVGQICLHSCMAGVRLAAPLQALRQGHSAWEVGVLLGLFALAPVLLALPAALAASWGFMLPAGTGPNALAWATGHIALPRVLKAGLLLDLAGVPLMVAVVWSVAALT